MREYLEKTARFVDKAIPYLILLLFGIVIIDVFFHETSLKYSAPLFVLDAIIIAFFAVDLTFKYQRVKNIPRFLRLYWLDILAVFPFFLMLRLFEEILLLSERSITALRNLFHVGIILEEEIIVGEEAVKAARTAELIAKEGRVGLLSKFLKPLRRLPRLLKAISYFEHPSKKTTLYHKKKRSNIIHSV